MSKLTFVIRMVQWLRDKCFKLKFLNTLSSQSKFADRMRHDSRLDALWFIGCVHTGSALIQCNHCYPAGWRMLICLISRLTVRICRCAFCILELTSEFILAKRIHCTARDNITRRIKEKPRYGCRRAM